MGSFSITHWLILLVVVVVVFGTSKLKNAGKDLRGAVKGFKEAVKDEDKGHQKRHVLNHEPDTATTQPNAAVDDITVSATRADDGHK